MLLSFWIYLRFCIKNSVGRHCCLRDKLCQLWAKNRLNLFLRCNKKRIDKIEWNGNAIEAQHNTSIYRCNLNESTKLDLINFSPRIAMQSTFFFVLQFFFCCISGGYYIHARIRYTRIAYIWCNLNVIKRFLMQLIGDMHLTNVYLLDTHLILVHTCQCTAKKAEFS